MCENMSLFFCIIAVKVNIFLKPFFKISDVLIEVQTFLLAPPKATFPLPLSSLYCLKLLSNQKFLQFSEKMIIQGRQVQALGSMEVNDKIPFKRHKLILGDPGSMRSSIVLKEYNATSQHSFLLPLIFFKISSGSCSMHPHHWWALWA